MTLLNLSLLATEFTQVTDELNLEDLLYASALGNQAAFSKLYENTSPQLMAVALSILRNRSLAEEALQEAFVHIWYATKDYRRELGKPITWLSTIVRNCSIDLYRKQSRHHESSGDTEALLKIPDLKTVSTRDKELQELIDCLEPLPEEQRNSILMTYYHGHSHGDISNLLSQPLGTIKSWIRRGISKLRECLE